MIGGFFNCVGAYNLPTKYSIKNLQNRIFNILIIYIYIKVLKGNS